MAASSLRGVIRPAQPTCHLYPLVGLSQVSVIKCCQADRDDKAHKGEQHHLNGITGGRYKWSLSDTYKSRKSANACWSWRTFPSTLISSSENPANTVSFPNGLSATIHNLKLTKTCHGSQSLPMLSWFINGRSDPTDSTNQTNQLARLQTFMKSDYECSDKPESLRFFALFIVQRIAICKTSWPNDTQDEGDARSIPEFRLLRKRMPMNMLRQAFTCIHFSLDMFWLLSSLDKEPFKITFRNNFELPSLKLTVHTKFTLKMDGCSFMFISFRVLAYEIRCVLGTVRFREGPSDPPSLPSAPLYPVFQRWGWELATLNHHGTRHWRDKIVGPPKIDLKNIVK